VSDPRGRSAGPATRATPKLGDAGAHYTRPNEVPLRPGQTIGYTAGKGYYATTRPNPTRASTTPKSRTTKVTALSTRASTESPLKQHIETRDGKTSITLYHATKPGRESQERRVSARASERSAKPTQGHAHRTTVETKKASLRVDEQLAKNKDQSHHAKSGIGHHPGRAKHDPVATAASAGGRHSRHKTGVEVRKASPRIHEQLSRRKEGQRDGGDRGKFHSLHQVVAALELDPTYKAPLKAFTTPRYDGEIEATATAGPVRISRSGDQLVFKLGNTVLYSLSLGAFFSQFDKLITPNVARVAQEVENEETASRTVTIPGSDGGTVTYSFSLEGGLSITTRNGEVENELTFSPDGEVGIAIKRAAPVGKTGTEVALGVDATLVPRGGLRKRKPDPSEHPETVLELALAAFLATAKSFVTNPEVTIVSFAPA